MHDNFISFYILVWYTNILYKCYLPQSRMKTMSPNFINLRPSNTINISLPLAQEPTHIHIQSYFPYTAGHVGYLPSKLSE